MKRRMKRFLATVMAFTMALSLVGTDAVAAGQRSRIDASQSVEVSESEESMEESELVSAEAPDEEALIEEASEETIEEAEVTEEAIDETEVTWEAEEKDLGDSKGMIVNLYEMFETNRSSVPDGWVSSPNTSSNSWYDIEFYDTAGSDKFAYEGKMLCRVRAQTGRRVWLYSPTLDLSGQSSARLDFWYIKRDYYSYSDEFSISYRVNSGDWQQVFYTEEKANDWTHCVIDLPAGALKANAQIGFSFFDCAGGEMAIDKVMVYQYDANARYTVSYNANGGSGQMTATQSSFQVGQSAVVLGNQYVTPSSNKYFAYWNTKADGSGVNYAPGDMIDMFDNVTLYAQWLPYLTGLDEGFDSDSALPSSWTVVADPAVPKYLWEPGYGDYYTDLRSHSGYRNAVVKGCNVSDSYTWLISPQMDLSGQTNPVLHYWYATRSSSSVGDQLSVNYRVGQGEWHELVLHATVTSGWTEFFVALPAQACTKNVQIGFKAVENGGTGVALDEVKLYDAGTSVKYTVTYAANGGSGQTTDSNRYPLGAGATILASGFTAPSGKYFGYWTTAADGSGAVYEPGDTLIVQGNITLYAHWITLATSLDEVFENGLADGWKVIVDPNISNIDWGAYEYSAGAHSGTTYFRANGRKRTDVGETWLTTPVLDLRTSGKSYLNFWYSNYTVIYSENGTDTYYHSDLGVYYRIGSGAWNEVFYTTNSQRDWTEVLVELPAATHVQNVQFGFKCDYKGNVVDLDDVKIFTVANSSNCSITYQPNGGGGSAVTVSGYTVGQQAGLRGCIFNAPAGKYWTGWNTRADGSGIAYGSGDTATVTGNLVLYANWEDGIDSINESFTSGIPSTWTISATASTYTWQKGSGCAVVKGSSEDTDATTWLMSPRMNLSARAGAELSFKIRERVQGTLYDQVSVYYRAGYGGWTLIAEELERPYDWEQFYYMLPSGALRDDVQIGFKVVAKAGKTVELDDVVVTPSDEKLYALKGSGKTAKPYAREGERVTVQAVEAEDATIKAFYVYNYHGNNPQTTLVGENTYTFTMPDYEVTFNTVYNDRNFKDYFDGFEESKSTSGWTFVDTDGDGKGWKRKKADPSRTKSGDYVLYAPVSTTASDNWAITPAIRVGTAANKPYLCFSVRDSKGGANAKMSVYAGTSPDVASMTALKSNITVTDEYVFYKIDLSSYAGQFVYFGFRQQGAADYSSQIYLDNVAVYAVQYGPVVMRSAATSFDGKIGLVYNLFIPDYILRSSNVYVQFTQNGETKTKDMSDIFAGGVSTDGTYRVVLYMPAAYWRDTVNLKIYYHNGAYDSLVAMQGTSGTDYTVNGVNYSVKQYVDTLKNYSDAKIKALAYSLEDYGTAAQIYFGHNASGLSVSSAVNNVTQDLLSGYASVRSGTLPSSISGLSLRASFDNANTLKLGVNFKNGNPGNLTYKLDDKTTKLYGSEEEGYYLAAKSVPAAYLQRGYKFTISDGSKTYNITCSVLTYVRATAFSSDPSATASLKNMTKALYNYAKATGEYFGTWQ